MEDDGQHRARHQPCKGRHLVTSAGRGVDAFGGRPMWSGWLSPGPIDSFLMEYHPKFQHSGFLGDKRTQLVYDLQS